MRFAWTVPLVAGFCAVWAAAADDKPAVGDDKPAALELWPGKVPDESGDIGAEKVLMSPKLDSKQVEVTEPTRMVTNVSRPSITVYRPAKDKDTGTAMVICPGGGYWNLYWQQEGEEVAAWLNSLGVSGNHPQVPGAATPDEPKGEPARRPLQDAQRAVSLVRSKAKEWGVAADRIGMVGFSAGGHLAIATATSFDKRSYEPSDDVDAISCRPDFAILLYSGYLKDKDKDVLAPGLRVPKGTPPVFLRMAGPTSSAIPKTAWSCTAPWSGPACRWSCTFTRGQPTTSASGQATIPARRGRSLAADWLRDQGFLKPPTRP